MVHLRCGHNLEAYSLMQHCQNKKKFIPQDPLLIPCPMCESLSRLTFLNDRELAATFQNNRTLYNALFKDISVNSS